METMCARVVGIDERQATTALRVGTGAAAAAPGVRVDGWLVQPSLNLITRNQVSIRLRPQLVDLLLCLASQPGEVFGKEELVAEVWEGRFVAESAISRCVAELRSALGDDAQRPHIIETIIKRGYRLIAPVERVSVPAPEPAAEPLSAERQASDGPRPSLWRRLGRAVTLVAVSSAVGARFRP